MVGEAASTWNPTAAGIQRRPRWFQLVRDPGVIFGVVVFLIVTVCAIAAPVLAPHDPAKQSLSNRLKPPTALGGPEGYVLGTDNLGRDVLSRLIYGSRISLIVAVVTVVGAGTFGSILGAIAGYYGGWVDNVIMRIVDAWLAFPFLLLAIALAAALGAGLDKLILALVLSRWVIFCRTARAEALAIREREFVQAAHALGARNRRIILRHVLPNMLPPLFAIATLEMATVVVSEASLSFLGLGVQGTMPTWGGMLADGRQYVREAWWLTTFAGLAITILVLGFNLLGNALAEYFDPRLRARR